MNELNHIKKIEKEITDGINSAEIEADEKIDEVKAKREEVIQKRVKKAKEEVDMLLMESRGDAEDEAESILKNAEKDAKKIQEIGSKRMDDAVDLVLNEIVGR